MFSYYKILDGKLVHSHDDRGDFMLQVINNPYLYAKNVNDGFNDAFGHTGVYFLLCKILYCGDEDDKKAYANLINGMLNAGYDDVDGTLILLKSSEMFINAVKAGVNISKFYYIENIISNLILSCESDIFETVIDMMPYEFLWKFSIDGYNMFSNANSYLQSAIQLASSRTSNEELSKRITLIYRKKLISLMKQNVVDNEQNVRRIFPFPICGGHILIYELIAEHIEISIVDTS
jgi:hypothetical protein